MARFASFREFYPFYLAEHSNRTSRRLHFIGSCGVLVLLAVALVERNAWWLLAALLYLGRHVARSVLDPAATPGYFTERGVGQRA